MEQTTRNTDSNHEHQTVVDTHESGAEETQNQDATAVENAELAELKDKYIRLYADFDNFRKRTNRERLEVIQSANRDLMLALLPVLDDFDRAFKNLGDKTSGDPVLEGFKLIHHKLIDIMNHKGLKPMESSVGKEFDVETMEAVTNVPVQDESQKGKVIDELERGYMLGEKILRFAKVVVGE
ncbi:nucleotide exchange factor GrpE [Schleiferia thermophila]|jgi:molecular chaperone GrpE|nr:nucleotide exchange factor GrpE [Schleiferia thermophila]GCD79958.1 protein GrpE [Schleiferia thermophila]